MNRPYEEESGVVPNIMMGGILAGASYTAYKVHKEESGWLGNKINKIQSKLYPAKAPTLTPFQKNITSMSESIGTGLKRGMEMKKATYEHRHTSMVNKLNEISSVGLKETGLNITADQIKNFNNGSIGASIDLANGVYSIDNKNIEEEVINKLRNLGVHATKDIEQGAGTGLRLKVGNSSIEVPLAKFDKETGAWIYKNSENAHYVAPYFRRAKLNGTQIEGSEFMSFNEYILDMIGDTEKALITANSDNPRNARDVLKYNLYKEKNIKSAEATKLIESIERKTNAERIVKDFHESFSVKQLFNRLQAHMLYSEGNNLGKMQMLGRTVKNDIYGDYLLDQAGYSGAMEAQATLNNMGSVSQEAIKAHSTLNEVTRGSSKNVFRGIHDPIKQQMQRYISYNVSQSQGAMWTSTFFPSMTNSSGIDTLKSVKHYTFHGEFPGMINKHAPLIWDAEAARLNPHTYNRIADHGHATMLGVINPHTEEVIQFHPSLSKNMKASRAVEIKVSGGYTWGGLPSEEQLLSDQNPEYVIKGKKFRDKTLFDLYNDTKTLEQVDYIDLHRGTIAGVNTANHQIDTMESYDRALTYKDGIVRTNSHIRQTKDDINRTLRGFGSGDQKVFYGQSIESLTKVGTYHDIRSVAQLMSPGDVARLGANQEGVMFDMSLDFFKKVFPSRAANGDIIAGKGAGSLLTTLQSMVGGHAYAAEKDIILPKNLTQSMTKYVGNFDGNISKLAKSGMLQFNQGAGGLGEQINLMTRVLAGMRTGNMTQSYDEAAKTITEHLRGLESNVLTKPFHILNTIFPQESLYTQGMGHNIYRMGINDMPYMMPNGVMEELAGSSIVDTQKIYSEGQMYMNFNKTSELADQLSSANIKTLNAQELDQMLGKGILNAKHIQDPSNLTKSFLNPELNPDGFALPTEDGRLAYFGSGDFYQKSQYLDDEERMAVSRDIRKETEILLNAKANGGVISAGDYQKIQDIRSTGNVASKEGYLKRGALQIEGSVLDKIYQDTHLINNKAIASQLEKGSELEHLFGNLTVVDKGTYRSSIVDELQKAKITADANNKSVSSFLDDRFGKDNIFSQHYENIEAGRFNGVAETIADQSVKDYHMLHDMLQAGDHEGAAKLIKESGQAMFNDRFPNIYSSSKSLSFGFATDQGTVAGGKFVAYGNRLRTLMNADNDGDISFVKFLFHQQNRQNTYDRILKEQSMSHDVLKSLGENRKTILNSIFENETKNYFMPGKKDLSALEKAMKLQETESVSAAWLTKATTGSAHVRTQEMTNAMMDKILGNKALTQEQQTRALISAIDIPSKEIVQGSISSKHVEKMLGATNKIDHMISNFGEISKGDMLQRFSSLQGEVGALHLYNTLHSLESRTGEVAPFMRADVKGNIRNEMETLTNIHTMFKRETPENVENALKILPGWDEAKAKAAAARYHKAAEGITFTNETDAFRTMGYSEKTSYFDFWKDLKKSSHYSAADGIDSLSRLHQGDEAAFNNALVHSEHLKRAFGLESILGEGFQSKLVKGEVTYNLIGMEQIKELMGKITPKKLGVAAGVGLIAMTAMNLISGDGTPEDINELPSVSNPSFGGGHRGTIGSPRMITSSMNNNVSMGLLTDRRSSYNETMQTVSALFGGRASNTVSVRSDGTDPYKSDMYQYRG